MNSINKQILIQSLHLFSIEKSRRNTFDTLRFWTPNLDRSSLGRNQNLFYRFNIKRSKLLIADQFQLLHSIESASVLYINFVIESMRVSLQLIRVIFVKIHRKTRSKLLNLNEIDFLSSAEQLRVSPIKVHFKTKQNYSWLSVWSYLNWIESNRNEST